jgi:hypothetical protein
MANYQRFPWKELPHKLRRKLFSAYCLAGIEMFQIRLIFDDDYDSSLVRGIRCEMWNFSRLCARPRHAWKIQCDRIAADHENRL